MECGKRVCPIGKNTGMLSGPVGMMWKVKAHLELNLAREVKGNKKGLFLSISITKRRQGNEMGSLVQED